MIVPRPGTDRSSTSRLSGEAGTYEHLIAGKGAFYRLAQRQLLQERQSLIHLASLSAIAVSLRFTAFAVQWIISVYWAWKLLA